MTTIELFEMKAIARLTEVSKLISEVDAAEVAKLGAALSCRLNTGKSVFLFGNGGSAATAGHFANDLARCSIGNRLRAISLSSNLSAVTAISNDLGYENVFVNQLQALASPGDLALAISVSGRSPNCIKAISWCNEANIDTACLVGSDGGAIKRIVTCSVHVHSDSYGAVEDAHSAILHTIAALIADQGLGEKTVAKDIRLA